ncbi:MAG: hypothetical protein EVA21_03100 [Alphaproteobacteria bacterium]|nr:MAG: hypothetical protein EVA21_03100 [Alphaproteobacteria bacterium]
MKSKNKIQFTLNLKIFLILLIFGMSYKVFANEKNFVIATIDRSPITYFDLKQKAKLIHFLRTKNNQYENLNKYFDLSLKSLISEKLLIKKAIEFNKNILDLTQKDAFKYILERNNNSIEFFENFLKKNDLSKSVVILNIQIEIIKKYLIGQMFEKEYDDYLKEISNISKNKNDEIDLEQIIINIDKKNVNLMNSLETQIDSLSNQGYSFKEIVKILSKNKSLKISAGRSGWQNKNDFKLNTFEKLFQFPEGEIIKEKFNNKINYLRIISKRENGKFSKREQIIELIRLSYANSKRERINLQKFYEKNSKLSCKDFYRKLNELEVFNLNYQKENLTNFSEKILLMINKTNVKKFTDPIIFNTENFQFYICNKDNINKKIQSKSTYDEKLLMQKVDILTNKILKILKKDAIIDLKIKVNELN